MPGNETADRVRNFFEPDSLPPSHQSQVGGGSWPILNNNPLLGAQTQNGMPLSYDSEHYNFQFLDSERGNGRQSPQMPFGTNHSQFTLKQDFDKAGNQQINLNSFMHGSHVLPARSTQAEFLGDATVSKRHSSMWRGLATFESHQGIPPQYSSDLTGNSESLEFAEASVNFDFGGQQKLMRNQHPGISQPRPRQQSAFKNMHVLQQHLMYKQLLDLQRQQQLQQLDQGSRHQNPRSQLSTIVKQVAVDQLPALLNGMPVNDASNYMWPNEFLGGESKTPTNSQMLVTGNTNWAHRSGSPAMHGFTNGLMFSHDCGQTVRPMGFVSQPLDHSLYGTPVSSTRGSLNYYSQLHGMPIDCTDVIAKEGENQVEKSSMGCVYPEQGFLPDGLSVAKQGFQGKTLFGNAAVQSPNSDSTSVSFQQVNHLSRSVQVQEFEDRQERADRSGNLQEKAAVQLGPSHSMANLDPTEEKFLSSTDDDGNWGTSFGRNSNISTGGYLQGNPLRSNDYFSGFPSLQSGSWSALMQEAVEASSSDTGLQEEWSGLSFQKTEVSTGNQSVVLNDNGKQQVSWDDNNQQSASSLTSRPFPLFNDSDASPYDHTASSFQHCPIRLGYEQDTSLESFQQSSKEANKQLDQSHQQQQYVEGALQAQMHLDNVSTGVWSGQMYEQSVNTSRSAGMESNSQNMQDVWAHQQKMALCNVSSLTSNKPNDWNIIGSLPPIEDTTLEIRDKSDAKQHSQRNDINRTMHVEMNHDGNTWEVVGSRVAILPPNSSGGLEPVISCVGNPKLLTENSYMGSVAAVMESNSLKASKEINQQVLNRHQVDNWKHVAADSSVKCKGDENVGYQHHPRGGPHAWESSTNITDKGLGETYDHKIENSHPKAVLSERFISDHSHRGQCTDNSGGAREHSLLAGSNFRPSVSDSQKSSGQVGHKTSGPRRFQYHAMGNLRMDVELADSSKHITYPQGLPQTILGLKNEGQGYIGHTQFAGHVISNNAMDMEKTHAINLQINAEGMEEIHYRGTIPSHDSPLSAPFDGSTAHFPQNKMVGQTSQNMLQLLHKVDQPRDVKTVASYSFSDRNTSLDTHEASASDGSASSLQHNQTSRLQGFGLQLAPPSQWQPVPNHALPSQAYSQTVNDFHSRHPDLEAGDRELTRSTIPSVPSTPSAHDTSQREIWDNKFSITGQTCKETSHSSRQGNSFELASSRPYTRNQLQEQHISSVTGHALVDQSVSLSFGSQGDMNAHDKQTSHLRQTHDSHDGVIAYQSTQPSPPFRLASSDDARAPAAPQFYSLETSHSQPMSASSSYLRSSWQQLPVVEKGAVPQVSVTPSTGGFSPMPHNVWTNVSAQQRLSGAHPHSATSNFVQSMSPLTSIVDANSWVPQKVDDQSNRKGGSAPAEFDTCSNNSQQFTYGEEHPAKEKSLQQMPLERVDVAAQTARASRGQEPVPNHLSDGNSAVSISSLVHLHQQDLTMAKHGHDSSPESQTEHYSLPDIAAFNNCAYGCSLKPSHVHQQNYSLMQQMQATKSAESDPSKRSEKRLKGADFGADASQMDWEPDQRFIYGHNSVFRVPTDDELAATSQHGSSNGKMLSFSTGGNEEKNVNTSSQLIDRVIPSQDMITSGRHDLQKHTHSLNISPTSTFTGRREHVRINPQMAPSWFEQYGTFENGQTSAMSNGLGSSLRNANAKAAAHHFFSAKVSESIGNNTVVNQRNDGNQDGRLWQSTLSTTIATNDSSSPHCSPSDVIEHNLVMRPKKRKSVTSELLPWHKEVTQGSRRLQSISMAELDWAQAANRVTEKVEDEVEMIGHGPSMLRPRRRLILTTQLIQQLLPSVPAALLSAEATSAYESVACFVAKLALGDACSLISCSGSDSLVHLDTGNMVPKKPKSSEMEGYHFFFKVVEDFIGSFRQLESDFSRLDKRTSILDIKVECQDLERYSIINRFAKFLGRGHTNEVENSSTSEAVPRRTFPQRYVTALSVPGNLPEGVLCLSL